ncbi:CAP domain-containing protein [Spirosoma sp. KCTC 42546]|uniref:CAP domain-containing protein n=1 Tax=Spirosoma sp. KCTC 42546 TaxID=2520506 RepID=UPI001158E689|nr:CAP domain-containing protein [Spirosoma sp. KCTC 42546]QDK81808.1 CAP domain-containing protein [Spirosoma sp. KCTC 42546]
MNWWMVFHVCQWVFTINNLPEGYLLSDQTFFAQSISQQTIDLEKPDTLLLDIALFQATNEARRQAGLTLLQYDLALYQAAQKHAQSMIAYNYYGHENFHSLSELTPMKRIDNQTKQFWRIAENIGQYQTIDTPEWFCVRLNKRTHQYEYLDSQTRQIFQPHTYAGYARYAVTQWLNSPHHRANLLNPLFTHVGCAGRLSTNPFRERKAPFGRLVQNFGTKRLFAQADH